MKIKMKRFLVLAVLVIFGVMSTGVAFADETLTIIGSTTVQPVAQRAAEVFMQKNPGVNITVSGGGSGTGIAQLIAGNADIGNASRFIKISEVYDAIANNIYPVPHKIALDGIAVIVHPSNPIDGLTKEQIKAIYTGEINNWKELGGNDQEIVILSRDSSSGTFEVFGEKVLEGAKVVAGALLKASNGTVKAEVAQTPGAIGYIGMGYIDSSVKVITVNGVYPTNATVASGEYPIFRPLFMFTKGWPESESLVGRFINFVLSPEGQKIVAEKYVPLYDVSE